ncbi:Protein lifeguard 2, partial [Schistosoma japonicum]
KSNFFKSGHVNREQDNDFIDKRANSKETPFIIGYPIPAIQLASSKQLRRPCLIVYIVDVRTLITATFLCTYFALVCCIEVRRRYPGNFIALSVFTLAFSYMMATITSFYDTQSVLIAVIITACLCIAISIFAMQTRIDFTKCTSLIFVLSIVFMLTGIAYMIVLAVTGQNRILQVVYGGLGALVFGVYLVFDIQQIVGGRKIELSPEEYIFGALQLYLDVVNLFLSIISLFTTRNT